MTRQEQAQYLERWGDVFLAIALHFNLPFFEMAAEKYDWVLLFSPSIPVVFFAYCFPSFSFQAIERYPKAADVYRKYGRLLAQQASFIERTQTAFTFSRADLFRLSNEKFTKALVRPLVVLHGGSVSPSLSQELDPASFKTVIRWARCLALNYTLKLAFVEAEYEFMTHFVIEFFSSRCFHRDLAREVEAKYVHALHCKPDAFWVFNEWYARLLDCHRAKL